MTIAFVVFDNMTALDFVGFYDAVTRLKSMNIQPDCDWHICARTPTVKDDRGMVIGADRVAESLAAYDLLYVPGGFGTRTLQRDEPFIEWIRTAAEVPLKVSVCTGALVLGAAGFLRGRRATTHPNALDELKLYSDSVIAERIVDDGDVITAGGVATSIDLGLHVVARLAGLDARTRIARQMDYPYGPPTAV